MLKPRILVVGVGRFGKEHLKTWQRLAAEGLVELSGAVVSSEERRSAMEDEYGIPVHVGLSARLLKEVDAVDIVTPSHTHFALARQCLPYVHVLLEKPLAMTQRQAQALKKFGQQSRHVLMVNHLYRFHPVFEVLQKLVKSTRARPSLIVGSFLNPLEPGCEKYSVNLEFLHYFDIIDQLFGEKAISVSAEHSNHVNEVSLQYAHKMNAVLQLGWKDSERIRTLEIQYAEKKLRANFQDNTIEVMRRNRREMNLVSQRERPLESALRRFLQVIQGKKAYYPDAKTGARIVDLALRAMPGPRKRKPRAVVMGGGIFGATCAIELAPFCEVVLAERHSELLTEASQNNQLRHHSGFHYPRSLETVQEIQSTRREFESAYNEAILRNVESYYCTAATAQTITGERYLAFCKENQLSFSVELPPEGLLDSNQVSLCLHTDELVLDIPRLREIVRAKLQKSPNIETRLGTEVLDGRITRTGRKLLSLRNRGVARKEEFDYLINATYANSNIVAKWFGFPVRPLRFDLCEMLLLEIPMPNVSIMILDGPFTSLMTAGRDNLFLFYQVRDGVLRSAVTPDGLPPSRELIQSNHDNMLRHSTKYLPILQESRYVESWYGLRTVAAFNEDHDGRPTVVHNHGFGCWSVLGGKIATSVSNAREIAGGIFPEARHSA